MLTNLLVAVGLMGGLSLTFSTLISRITKDSKRATIKLSMITTKNKLLMGLMSDKTWSESMSHPANAAAGNCFKNPYELCASNMSFQLFAPNNRALTAQANLNPGFTHNGQKCTGFDSVDGNRDCPIGINLRLERTCGTPCSSPILKVKMDFEYNHPNKTYRFNMLRLRSEFLKPVSSLNVIAEGQVISGTACITSIPFANVLFCQGEVVRLINLDKEGYLMLTGGASVHLQPTGVADPNITEKSFKLTIEVDDIEVAKDKVTSDNATAKGTEFKATRMASGSWTQKVGPGIVKLKARYTAWIVWQNAQPVFPEQVALNLSYLIYK